MKNKKLFLTITTILIFALLSALLLVGCTNWDKLKEKAEEVIDSFETPNVIEITEVEASGLSLSMGPTRVMNAGTENVYVERSVTATILPDSLTDKYVSWSIRWADNAVLNNDAISDYLQIDENTQGSLTVTLKCYKAFRGSNIILEAESRQGSKKANCLVTYVGVPTNVVINDPSGAGSYDIGTKVVDLLEVNRTYSLTLSASNIFNDVDPLFSDYQVDIIGYGNIIVDDFHQSARGQSWSFHPTKISFDSIVDKLVTVSVENGILKINTLNLYQNYYSSISEETVEGNGLTTITHDKFYDDDPDSLNLPYFGVKVYNDDYGFSAIYEFYMGEQVESLTLSPSSIIF